MSEYTELLSQYQPSQTEYDDYSKAHTGRHVVVLATFDHDWEQHLLVRQCSTGAAARFLGMDKWEYALYHKSGDMVSLIHTFFDVDSTPWVQAAEMVACWSKHQHYDGKQNAVESDSFD